MLPRILTTILVFSLLSAPSVFAAEADAPEALNGFQTYVRNFDQKFDRGGLNFVGGWTEIVHQPITYYKMGTKKSTRPLKAVQGFGVGLITGTADIVGGFLNVLTSPFPGWEIPLPQGGIQAQNITGGNPEAVLQTDDEYRVASPSRTPRTLYPS